MLEVGPVAQHVPMSVPHMDNHMGCLCLSQVQLHMSLLLSKAMLLLGAVVKCKLDNASSVV